MHEFRRDLGAAFHACSLGEFDRLRRRCRAIKGVARTFAAVELAELAAAIEHQVTARKPGDLASQLARLRTCAEHTLASLTSLRGSPRGVVR